MIINFADELPICQKRQEIAAAIQAHPVVIIAGETGSGKTTQIPKICLSIGRGQNGRIGHTQPRRLAAKAVALRLAEELKTNLGNEVGYKIRFNDKTSNTSIIKVMTDGILLAETQQDKYLRAYDTLIIDEAHERSINIDLILGILKSILPKRPDLKIIITSATIDPGKFASFFENAPIIEVSGRSYPVQIEYLITEESTELNQQILLALEKLPNDQHDVLVFLPGEREIHEAQQFLQQQNLNFTEILPLYARLSSKEQSRVFITGIKRKIILATNVAETSITLPGIRYVIDSGSARISRYNYKNQLQRLTTEAISKASAKQRAGRCGRVAPGICIRLYSEIDFLQRSAFTTPEILRTNLAMVVLKMLVLNLGDIYQFSFLEPLEPKMIKDGYKLLEQIGAIDANKLLTELGKQLARLPIDPKIGIILLKAVHFGCLQEILIIASALSVLDPREQTKEVAIQEIYKKYQAPDSDFLAYINLWNTIKEQQQILSKNKFKQFCAQEHLSWLRIKEWQDVYHELLDLTTEFGYKLNTIAASYQAIHQALLTGFMLNSGNLNEDKYYTGIKHNKFKIFPASVLFKKQPKWIMAFQILHTKDTYARVVAKIQVEWLESAAKHLLKYSYSESIWQKKTGQVVALEKATLYGLCIYANKYVSYARIDANAAREVFIREALVAGEYLRPPPILYYNQQLIAEIELLEQKTRQIGLLDEEQIYQFYTQVIPDNITNCRQFEAWLKTTDEKKLKLTKDILINLPSEQLNLDLPNYIINNNIKLTLEYCYDLNSKVDGITVIILLKDLNKLDKNIFTWLVPGLFVEKITALLKLLPKQVRKYIVPIPEFAAAIRNRIQYGVGHILDCIIQELYSITGIKLTQADFKEEDLPLYLQFNYKIVDDNNIELAAGRNLESITNKLYSKLDFLENTNKFYTAWEFNDLPELIDVKKDTLTIAMYVGLSDHKQGVAITHFLHTDAALLTHQQGLLRLLYFALAKEVKYLIKNIPNSNKLLLDIDALILGALQKTFLFAHPNIRTKQDFINCQTTFLPNLITNFNLLLKLLVTSKEIYAKLDKSLLVSFLPIQEQLEHLFAKQFLQTTPLNWLLRYPIYLQAIQHFLNNNKNLTNKLTEFNSKILPLWQFYLQHQQNCNFLHPNLVEYRWLLEELRVSIFAQHLKTIVPVSVDKLRKLQLQLSNEKTSVLQ